MRNLLILTATILAMAAGGAQAKACKDAKGHFAKCPAAFSVLPEKAAPTSIKADTAPTPKRLTKAQAKKELAAAQTPPPASTASSSKRAVGLMGLFKPKGAPAGAPATPMAASSTAPLVAPSAPAGHPICKKGKPCGNSCIAQNKVCHKA